MIAPKGSDGPRVRLWDIGVRVTHGGFIILLPALWWSWKTGDMEWHKLFGIIMLGLVAFRILWGLVGSSTARFSRFVRGPAAIFAYLRGGTNDEQPLPVGHNPLGGWSVIVMLSLLGFQVATGLIAQDVDGLESGPLNHLVSYETADAARAVHGLIFNILLALIALHICAIFYYTVVRRDSLIAPMITGFRRFSGRIIEPVMASPLRLIMCITFAAALASWISNGAPLPQGE